MKRHSTDRGEVEIAVPGLAKQMSRGVDADLSALSDQLGTMGPRPTRGKALGTPFYMAPEQVRGGCRSSPARYPTPEDLLRSLGETSGTGTRVKQQRYFQANLNAFKRL